MMHTVNFSCSSIYSSVSTLVSSTAFGLVIEESSVQRKATKGEQIATAERKKAAITALVSIYCHDEVTVPCCGHKPQEM